jgi:hypothetical protein
VIDNNSRLEFLKKNHLFFGIGDEQLLSIATLLNEHHYQSDKEVYIQGGPATSLYIIYDGTVQILRQQDGKLITQAALRGGDIFGGEELLNQKPRHATAIAEANTTVFSLAFEQIRLLFKQTPRLRTILEIDNRSEQLARLLRFDWLGDDENVHFLARKHWVILVQWLIAPMLALGIFSFLLAWGVLTHAMIPAYIGGILIWPAIGWAGWMALDWSNDYYIVTNKRIVWLEKVIGLYDSRREAPLTTVLAVGVETDLIGRMLDYGTVVVRTFVSRIEFNHVIHPYAAAHLITEHWERTKSETSRTEKQAMLEVLRDRLGQTTQAQPQPVEAELKPAGRSIMLALTKLLGGNLFKIKLEDSGTITYRKHWFVLIKKTWQPGFFLIVLFAWTFKHSLDLLAGGSLLQQTLDGRVLPDTLLLSQLLGLFLVSLWFVYQFWDWRNDIFQVTPDQIVDIDKKPFGTEERRAAPLDNILSTQYSRIGLAGYIFNFGTVYITVGGSQLAFEDVSDPASVQADIDRRRLTSLSGKKESEARRERERMADWLAAYRENLDSMGQGHEPSRDENKIE